MVFIQHLEFCQNVQIVKSVYRQAQKTFHLFFLFFDSLSLLYTCIKFSIIILLIQLTFSATYSQSQEYILDTRNGSTLAPLFCWEGYLSSLVLIVTLSLVLYLPTTWLLKFFPKFKCLLIFFLPKIILYENWFYYFIFFILYVMLHCLTRKIL